MYVYIYIYMFIYMYTYIYIYRHTRNILPAASTTTVDTSCTTVSADASWIVLAGAAFNSGSGAGTEAGKNQISQKSALKSLYTVNSVAS